MFKIQKHKTIFLTIFLWSCVSVRANEVSVSHLLKDFYVNGNPIAVEDTTANTLRVMQWDEENRLQALGDDGYVSRYTYNHAGERVIKSHGPTTVAFVNGVPQGILWHDKDNWTMYVSPYMVVNSDRFTKHYYAGSQRIASKIGAGEFNNIYNSSTPSVTAGQKDYAERLNKTEIIEYGGEPSIGMIGGRGFALKYVGSNTNNLNAVKLTFSEYLHMTKGQYKGIKGRGNAMKAAAKDYHKLYKK